MAAAIIWRSTMGISRRYAEEVKKQLNADIFEADKVSADKLTRYQTVAVFGGVYNDKWECADFVKKCRTVLQNRKTVFVFAVWDDAPENIPSDSLKNKYLANIVISPDSCLAVEGQIDKSKVSFGQKLSLSGMKKKLMKKENKDDHDFSIIGMIDGYSGGFKQEAADRVAAVIKSMD